RLEPDRDDRYVLAAEGGLVDALAELLAHARQRLREPADVPAHRLDPFEDLKRRVPVSAPLGVEGLFELRLQPGAPALRLAPSRRAGEPRGREIRTGLENRVARERKVAAHGLDRPFPVEDR